LKTTSAIIPRYLECVIQTFVVSVLKSVATKRIVETNRLRILVSITVNCKVWRLGVAM
jgi:hypothetical protein